MVNSIVRPPPALNVATDRGPQRGKCSLRNPGRQPRILDPGLQAWDAGLIPHPNRGPSLSPPTSFLGLPALWPAGHPWPALPSSLQSPLQKALRPLLQRYTANPDSFTIQMGGGCKGGKGPPIPEVGREGLSISESEKGVPSFPRQGLWSLSELGGPGSIICPRLPSPKSDPIPAPSQAAAVSAGLG